MLPSFGARIRQSLAHSDIARRASNTLEELLGVVPLDLFQDIGIGVRLSPISFNCSRVEVDR